MGTKSGHLAGGKYTSRHTTVIEAAVSPVEAAARLACVSKVSLGIIRRIPSADPLLKFMDDGPGCLLAKVRGRASIQEVRIYTSDKEAVSEAMTAAFLKAF